MPTVITRQRLAEHAAQVTGIATAECYSVISAAVEAMSKELSSGNRIALRGFGAFRLKHVRATEVNSHFAPNEIIEIPAHAAVRFKPYRELKIAVAKLKVPAVDR